MSHVFFLLFQVLFLPLVLLFFGLENSLLLLMYNNVMTGYLTARKRGRLFFEGGIAISCLQNSINYPRFNQVYVLRYNFNTSFVSSKDI